MLSRNRDYNLPGVNPVVCSIASGTITLPKTFRMHPDITRFISEVSYNGRLSAEIHSAGQGLIL